MPNIYTHDRVDLTAGLMGNATLLYGGNALQTVNITRNTPKGVQSAIGYLGCVDYTHGVVTSDVTLDTILIEGCTAPATGPSDANPSSTINKWGQQTIDLATEKYYLTSFAMALAAGTPATCNYGWITAGLASYLKTKVSPTSGTYYGTGSNVQMVLGDESNGLILLAAWAAPVAGAGQVDMSTGTYNSTIPTLDANGNLTSVSDYGLPVGVQSVHLSSSLNRDNVLDIRSTRPAAFITSYPIDMSMEMEVYQLPGTSDASTQKPAWNQLTSLTVMAANGGKVYAKALTPQKLTEGESSAVGRYIAYTVNFRVTDLWVPVGAVN